MKEKIKNLINPSINISRDDFFNFIKNEKDTDSHITKRTQHYLDFYDKHHAIGKRINWNWSGLFCFSLWCLYRRMFLNAFAFNLLELKVGKFVDNFIFERINVESFFIQPSVIIWCIFHIILAFYGDYVYLDFVNRKFASKVKRGTTLVYPIIAIILTIVVIFILN